MAISLIEIPFRWNYKHFTSSFYIENIRLLAANNLGNLCSSYWSSCGCSTNLYMINFIDFWQVICLCPFFFIEMISESHLNGSLFAYLFDIGIIAIIIQFFPYSNGIHKKASTFHVAHLFLLKHDSIRHHILWTMWEATNDRKPSNYWLLIFNLHNFYQTISRINFRRVLKS